MQVPTVISEIVRIYFPHTFGLVRLISESQGRRWFISDGRYPEV